MKKESRLNKAIFSDIEDGDLVDIQIQEGDIINAIGGLKNNSAAGPDGIPAKFLISTKNAIATPLSIIMRKSMDEGKIPDIFKLAYVAPIHKGGSKLKPEQYRPVSLTSHIMKVFERVLKVNIMEHLVTQKLINPGQHGFVPGGAPKPNYYSTTVMYMKPLLKESELILCIWTSQKPSIK
ncbi:unnamed protein product [Meganyctiphanes norvegica]|uniref:Reverse transcriptase domain-containing protein n=1 Tax=Meganyctiphanes norvegica TaxID=48144 RepID=A0AAV2SQS5_MEGNR